MNTQANGSSSYSYINPYNIKRGQLFGAGGVLHKHILAQNSIVVLRPRKAIVSHTYTHTHKHSQFIHIAKVEWIPCAVCMRVEYVCVCGCDDHAWQSLYAKCAHIQHAIICCAICCVSCAHTTQQRNTYVHKARFAFVIRRSVEVGMRVCGGWMDAFCKLALNIETRMVDISTYIYRWMEEWHWICGRFLDMVV